MYLKIGSNWEADRPIWLPCRRAEPKTDYDTEGIRETGTKTVAGLESLTDLYRGGTDIPVNCGSDDVWIAKH